MGEGKVFFYEYWAIISISGNGTAHIRLSERTAGTASRASLCIPQGSSIIQASRGPGTRVVTNIQIPDLFQQRGRVFGFPSHRLMTGETIGPHPEAVNLRHRRPGECAGALWALARITRREPRITSLRPFPCRAS